MENMCGVPGRVGARKFPNIFSQKWQPQHKLITAFRDQFGCFGQVSKNWNIFRNATSACYIKPLHEDDPHWNCREKSEIWFRYFGFDKQASTSDGTPNRHEPFRNTCIKLEPGTSGTMPGQREKGDIELHSGKPQRKTNMAQTQRVAHRNTACTHWVIKHYLLK